MKLRKCQKCCSDFFPTAAKPRARWCPGCVGKPKAPTPAEIAAGFARLLDEDRARAAAAEGVVREVTVGDGRGAPSRITPRIVFDGPNLPPSLKHFEEPEDPTVDLRRLRAMDAARAAGGWDDTFEDNDLLAMARESEE